MYPRMQLFHPAADPFRFPPPSRSSFSPQPQNHGAQKTGASSFTKLPFHSFVSPRCSYTAVSESLINRGVERVSPGSQLAEKSDTALQESQPLMSCQDPSPTGSFTSQ